MTEDQIKHMVSRFLSWKLPEHFNPDGGISFERDYNQNTPYPAKHEPVGTNLFDATQATAMVRYMLDGLPMDVRVNDLTMLLGMALKHVPKDKSIHAKAIEYINRHGLASPLRDESAALPASEAGAEPVAWFHIPTGAVVDPLARDLLVARFSKELELDVSGEFEPLCRSYASPSIPAIEDGYVLVPREPTEAMKEAGMGPFLASHDPFFSANEPCGPIYRAMLAASPPRKEPGQ